MPVIYTHSAPLIDPLPSLNIDIPYSVITIGTDEDDSLIGTEETDAIDGRLGNDEISGLSNNDAISGNEGDDTINGNEGDDLLFGHQGNDTIFGGTGEDIIIGVDPRSGFGISEIDILKGDEGEDTFVLGDQNNVYYVDSDPTSSGEQDYGLIVDFTVGEDKIELHGTPDNYLLDFYTTSEGTVKADIVYDPGVAARGELIGILEEVSADLTLTDSSFVYGENDYAVLYNQIFEPLEPLEPGSYYNAGFSVVNTSTGSSFISISNPILAPIFDISIPPNVVQGTSNDDVLMGTEEDDIIYGYEGNDQISGLGGDDTIFGGQGNDTISGGDGNDNLQGGEDDDLITGDGGNDVIAGDSGNDNLSGELGDDTITGGTGIDTISGGEGNDNLQGGEDDDVITGDAGNDVIAGDSGNDNLSGGLGDDIITGGTGIDTISGGDGNDNLAGGENNDFITGDDGNDVIAGDSGNDNLSGGLGDDEITGGLGNDTLTGGEGSDNLNGDEGNDVLAGTTADSSQTDEIDVLRGGLGSDRFILGDETGVYYDDGDPLSLGESDFALITDFNGDQDSIQLHGLKEFYYLDFFTTSEGLINAALMYDPGVTARRELIGIIEDATVDLTLEDSYFIFVAQESPLNPNPQDPIPSMIMGRNDRDILTGTDSNDVITGFKGRDIITTGGGNDQIVYTHISDRGDIITDFEVGNDVFVMTELLDSVGYEGIDPIAEGYLGFASHGEDTIIRFDADGTTGRGWAFSMILVEGVTSNELNNASNFIF